MQKVCVKYYDNKANLIDEEILPLETYCLKKSQDVMGILCKIEEIGLQDTYPEEYKYIRHKIFDICGVFQRLPKDLVQEVLG